MDKLAAQNVVCRLGDHTVFTGLDLAVREGEFLSVIGPSGCGKTTLLHLLAGLRAPDSGAITADGAPMGGPSVRRAVVFQEYSLFPWLNAERNIAFAVRQAHKTLSRRAAEAVARRYLAEVGLADCARRYPAQLSGGMRQRVAIARALAMDAEILLFDEPFGALDAPTRLKLQLLLLSCWQKQVPPKTVVFVTHDIEEALLLSDRIVCLGGGGAAGEVRVTLPRPRDRAAILGAECARLRGELLQLLLQGEGGARA